MSACRYKRGCAGRRGVVVSVLRPQPDAGGAGAAFEPSVGSGSLREGKAGSGGLLTEGLMKFKSWHLRGFYFRGRRLIKFSMIQKSRLCFYISVVVESGERKKRGGFCMITAGSCTIRCGSCCGEGRLWRRQQRKEKRLFFTFSNVIRVYKEGTARQEGLGSKK